VKVSALASEHLKIVAPARVFYSQAAFTKAFESGELDNDMVAVLPFQGPKANGMPELHKLTPYLGVLQSNGRKVALLTDGRMSGASGNVLAAIQMTPEAANGGGIALIQDGDLIQIDSELGVIAVETDLSSRAAPVVDLASQHQGMGRELFHSFRTQVGSAETGASIFLEA